MWQSCCQFILLQIGRIMHFDLTVMEMSLTSMSVTLHHITISQSPRPTFFSNQTANLALWVEQVICELVKSLHQYIYMIYLEIAEYRPHSAFVHFVYSLWISYRRISANYYAKTWQVIWNQGMNQTIEPLHILTCLASHWNQQVQHPTFICFAAVAVAIFAWTWST